MSSSQALQIRILTHNIRYATSSPFPGEQPWPNRLPGLLSELKYHSRHNPEALICLQEVLRGQLGDLVGGLNGCAPKRRKKEEDEEWEGKDGEEGEEGEEEGKEEGEWAYFGVGRDDGLTKGEYAPIFYRPAVWDRVFARTVWLSETPWVAGSRGWDAASVRVCEVLVLESRKGRGDGDDGEEGEEEGEEGWVICDIHGEKEKKKATRRRGKRLLLLNTHLDDQGIISRRESAKLILRLIPPLQKRWDIDAVVLAGDLNSEAPADSRSSSDEDDALIQTPAPTTTTTTSTPEATLPPFPARTAPPHNPTLEETYQRKGKEKEKKQETIDAYTILNASSSPLRDLRLLVREQQQQGESESGCEYGDAMTFTGFDGKGDGEGRCTRIDFIHLGIAPGEDEDEDEDEVQLQLQRDGGWDASYPNSRQRRRRRRLVTKAPAQKDGTTSTTEHGTSARRCKCKCKCKGQTDTKQTKQRQTKTQTPWQISGYAVLPNRFDDGVYISDHRAVVGDLVLN